MERVARKLVGKTHRRIVKPVLFRIHPDTVHHAMVHTSRHVSRIKPALWAGRKSMVYRNDAYLSQELFGLTFANPLGISAGLDKNADMPHIARMIGCGFTTTGSMTIVPRKGNDHPWFYRLPKSRSLVVHVGMANEGMGVIRPRLARRPADMPTVVSVAVVARDGTCGEAEIIADVREGIRFLVEHGLADIIEVNISCPNIQGDQQFARPESLERLLSAVDAARTGVPIFIKMPNSPDWEQFQALLDVIMKHAVQAVVIANLIKDRNSIELKDDLPSEVKGGVSGEPIRQRSLRLIRNTYEYCGDRLAIVGVGGTFSAQDAYEKVKAGASLVGLITGLIFEGPQIIGELNEGMVELMKRDGFSHISEVIGSGTVRGSKINH